MLASTPVHYASISVRIHLIFFLAMICQVAPFLFFFLKEAVASKKDYYDDTMLHHHPLYEDTTVISYQLAIIITTA